MIYLLLSKKLFHEPTFFPLDFPRMFYDEELDASERFYKSQALGLQLCYALYNLLVAHSEMVCYLVIILNHMISASMATLVLPVLIFLWAMLSVPRPSKRFWMTAIIYTEANSSLNSSPILFKHVYRNVLLADIHCQRNPDICNKFN